jgi:hypothetical protein
MIIVQSPSYGKSEGSLSFSKVERPKEKTEIEGDEKEGNGFGR